MKIIKSFIIGVGIGQLFYLISIFLAGVQTQTLANMASVALLSGLMGIASLVYDWRQLSLLRQSLFHYVLILALAMIMNLYNHWLPLSYFSLFILEFSIIYLIIWSLLYMKTRWTITKINQTLVENRKKD
ncbi:DUF3021 domain-containing protein [Streptococcus saliviloxodontae]|uniref:DUF3021 domain-containing protein n=1 Tax=Streptococcus saliviloxodontae TaxID=1349416 RepID=A0ABS2PIH8_9STRE|nr:DUF3021 domain-containing protein [Streptococcus saliviloxodontae]MBM7635225.1 hypothetical protein [Streptococcus saliviloxodontae]